MTLIAFILKVFHLVERRSRTKSRKMELHEHLRKARTDAKLSIKEVAGHLGVGRAQIWRMEKNADFISVERLRILADLYGLPLKSFFDDDLGINEADIGYQLIGMAITATEEVASRLPERPKPELLRSAVITVIRAQQKRWAIDPIKRFNPDEFVVLIEREFEEDKNT